MGFFDKLKDSWSDWDFSWDKAAEGFATAGKDAWGGILAGLAGTANLVMSPFDDDLTARAALSDYGRALSKGTSALGGLGTGLNEIPVARQLLGTADWAQTELVKRPLATSLLMSGDATREGSFPWTDPERWRKAYNTTTYVTPGQAWFYNTVANAQASAGLFVDEPSDIQRRNILREFPTLGVLAQDPSSIDPRNRDARRQYYDNPFMKVMSGTMDAAITMFADPTVVASKLTVAGKTRYWSKSMNAAAIQSGRHLDFQSARAYERTKAYIAEADSPATVELTVFNRHYSGSTAANLLWSVARDQRKYDQLGGEHDLFDLTWRALYGDSDAFDTLAKDAPRVADVIGSRFANYSIGQVAKQYGLGDEAVDAQWDALRETRTAAWVDALANGHGLYGQLKKSVESGGLLTGQNTPRLRTSSVWRAGVHQWMRNGPTASLGMWARRATHVLPSARTGRMLDVNDINGAQLLRANLEHSRLSQNEINNWVSAYGRMNSSESRFAVFNRAENAAFMAHATAYGMTPKQIDALLPQINTWRTGARRVMSSSRRFMSADVRQVAKQRLAEGRTAEADQLNRQADEIDAAVKRGEQPAAVYQIPDEDGNLAIIPEDTDIATTAPVLLTQHADVVPMQDWNVLENALWWTTKGGFGKRAYKVIDGTTSALDAVMGVWKIAAILRPGYVWRALSDEVGRTWATLGTGRTLMGTVGGVKHSAYNMSSRGRLLGEVMSSAVTRRRAAGQTSVDVDGEVVDQAAAVELPPAARLSGRVGFDPDRRPRRDGDTLVYGSYERALADGVLGVEDYLDRVTAHGIGGTLSPLLSQVYNAYATAGTISERVFRRHAVDAAMLLSGRGTYTSPSWQQAVLDEVQAAHKGKAAGVVGDGVLVDPFTGTSPRTSWAKAQDQFTFGNSRVLTPDADGVFDADGVYDFIADNMDELLKPGSLLATYQRPDGMVSLSVARVNPEAAERLAVKPSGGRRIKLPLLKGEGRLYRDSGSASFKIRTAAGEVEIKGAFEGPDGDLFRQQAGSRGVGESWTEMLSDIEHARLMAKSGRWVDITPERPEYPEAWERAVNLQLGQDPVARQFLAGKSVDDVIAWMHNTSAGRAYNAKMGPWRSRYAEQVQIVQAMVDTYAPIVANDVDGSLALRQRVLAGSAKLEDFERIMVRDDMPRVHGPSIEYATGRGPWMDWLRRRVDGTFKLLSDIPSDKFVRYPFAAERYKMHVDDLVKSRAAELAKRAETFSTDDLHAIESAARSRANLDVRNYLYDSAASLDLAKAFRLLVPFGSAIGDSTTKWGVVLRENPHVALQLWKLWQAPDRAGLVQDEDGNQLAIEDGKEVWYQVHPETGARTKIEDPGKQRLIVFRLPSWLGPEYANGMRPTARISKDVFHTFLDKPTFGPLVTVPANEFALSNPEFAEKRFVQTFILPFGPSEDWKRSGVPGNVRNLWERFVEGDKGEEFATSAGSIFATELVRYGRGERTEPPTYEEARAKAADMRGLRFWYRFGGVSAQFVSPYQPYIDYYHALRVKDSATADERFYDEMGPEFFALTASVTRNAMGLPATVGSFNQHRKLKDLMEQFPELSPLIAGAEGAGEFSRAVYEAQKQTPLRFGASGMMRERMDPYESWAEVERRRGWVEYGRFMDAVHADMVKLGVTSLEQKAAAPIKAARERWLNSHMQVDSPYGGTIVSPWYQDYATFDTSKMTSRLHDLRQIVQDPRLQGRDDMRGLVDYLDMREQFAQAMRVRGIASLKSSEQLATQSLRVTRKSRQTLELSRQWQSAVFQLKNQNLSFSALYDRWLSNDETLEAI